MSDASVNTSLWKSKISYEYGALNVSILCTQTKKDILPLKYSFVVGYLPIILPFWEDEVQISLVENQDEVAAFCGCIMKLQCKWKQEHLAQIHLLWCIMSDSI